jgi:diguanylate cyclase
MPEHLVQLGLSKPQPTSDGQVEILRWLVGQLLTLAVSTLSEIEQSERAGLEDAVERYKRRIMSPDQAAALEADAHGCAALCERELTRARGAVRERENGLREIIAVMMEAVNQLVGDSKEFNSSLIGESDRMTKLVETDDIKKLKKLVTEHVDGLRKTVVEKQKRDEASQSKLTRRVELLQTRLTEAEQEASSDPLTGVANRRAFDRAMQRLVSAANAGGRPLAMAMVDADHMKHLNDTHGHQIGDRVLIGLVQHVQAVVRKSDFLARYGGDEFAVAMPDMTVTEAQSRLEQVVREIAATKFEYEGEKGPGVVQFTISCGLTAHGAGDTVEELVKRADDALYDAKKGGKNRVAVRLRSKFGSWIGKITGGGTARDKTAA